MAVSDKQRTTVLTCLEQGMSLRKACIKAEIADPIEIRRLCKVDSDFESQYTHARVEGYLTRADKLMDDAWNMDIPADQKRLILDSQRWELAKMLPKLFGDRLNLEHSGSVARTDALTDDELQAVVQAKTPPTRY